MGETTVGNLAVDFICKFQKNVQELLENSTDRLSRLEQSEGTRLKNKTNKKNPMKSVLHEQPQIPQTQPDDPKMPLQTHLQFSSSQNEEEIGGLITDQPKQNKPMTWSSLPKAAFTRQESWPCSCLTCPSFAHIRRVYK